MAKPFKFQRNTLMFVCNSLGEGDNDWRAGGKMLLDCFMGSVLGSSVFDDVSFSSYSSLKTPTHNFVVSMVVK